MRRRVERVVLSAVLRRFHAQAAVTSDAAGRARSRRTWPSLVVVAPRRCARPAVPRSSCRRRTVRRYQQDRRGRSPPFRISSSGLKPVGHRTQALDLRRARPAPPPLPSPRPGLPGRWLPCHHATARRDARVTDAPRQSPGTWLATRARCLPRSLTARRGGARLRRKDARRQIRVPYASILSMNFGRMPVPVKYPSHLGRSGRRSGRSGRCPASR